MRHLSLNNQYMTLYLGEKESYLSILNHFHFSNDEGSIIYFASY